jgi:ATP-dependent helicase/DNAse subunit B
MASGPRATMSAMPLTLVLGPANSAKAGEVLGAYGSATRRGAVLVVPTRADVEHYSRELAAEGAVLGGAVHTFTGLVGEIAARAGYIAEPVSALQRERVVRRVLDSSRLALLSRSADSPGFAAAAVRLLSELERSLITSPRFAQAMRAWAGEDPARRLYADDVGSIYLAYARELERLGRVDADLYAWRALDALRAAPASWGTRPVFFYGFDDLTPVQRDAVETLARAVDVAVTVSLTYEVGHEALRARAEAVEQLRPLATRVLELPAANDHYEPAARAVLYRLERRLFEPPGSGQQSIEPGSVVCLLEAGGERAEAELVSSEVLALLAAGVPGDEIAVIYRSPARSVALVENVFGSAGIPLSFEHQVAFAHTTLGRSVLALARCALLDGARAEDLLDYLRSPGLLEHPELADALERHIRREGLRTAAQARAQLGWRLGEIDALREADDPAPELARQARRLFASPHRRRAPMLGADEELDARALSVLDRAVAGLGELGEELRGRELIEAVEELLVPAGTAPRPGAVLLAEPLAIRARRFRAIFVCGLQEGEFPLPAAPDPFLSDERRRELAAASGLVLRPNEDALERERYLFYACTSRATERVYLSYRSSDEEGNLALRSPFIDDVEELMADGWAERRTRRLLADIVWAPELAPTARERARARALATRPDSAVAEPPRTLGARALAHVRHREVVSPGALESYADCPVKWMVEKELQPDRFDPEPEPMARGSYMHNALERVLRGLQGPVTPESLPRALRLLGEVLAELPPTVARGRSEAVRRAVLRAIEADLRHYLEFEAASGQAWQPVRLEQRFGFAGDEASLPPLELGEGETQVRVRGMIDRVDVDPGGTRAIVRDYKSGSPSARHPGARWRQDRQLQVAIYMLVVRELLGLTAAGGLYQPLSGDRLRPRGIFLDDAVPAAGLFGTDARDAVALEEELEDAAVRAVALAERLRAGDLTPCPETCSRDGCLHPGICRVG